MKKLYLFAAMTAFGTLSFAQALKKVDLSGISKTESSTINQKAPGISLWSDTFSDPSQWVIGSATDTQGQWEIGNNSDPVIITDYSFYGTMASTTFADNFAYFDGLPFIVAGDVDPQNSWVEMANSLDLTGYDRVLFSFEQRYRAFNTNVTLVEMSLDNGVTWTESIDVNEDVPSNNLPIIQNTISQEFVVNGSNEVKFRFRWENPSDDNQAGSGYAWMVDDVNITSLPDNDVKTSKLYYGSSGIPYFQIPEAQIAPIDISVNVTSIGLNDQKGVKLLATETQDGVFKDSSQTVNLGFKESDSLVVASSFTPPAMGSYTIDFELLNDSIDDAPSNNILDSYNFEVGEYIYARDNGVPSNTLTGLNYIGEPIIAPGTIYDIYTNANLTGIDVRLGNSQPDEIEIIGKIYEYTATSIDEITETELYTTSNDGGKFVTLVFTEPIALEAGKTYVITVGAFTPELYVSAGGISEDGTSLFFGKLEGQEEGWYIEEYTPMVRMNFDPTLSVEKLEKSSLKVSQNFPNPFTDETKVEYTLEQATEVKYSIVDLSGKTILEVNEGNVLEGKHQITIDGSSLANGVYYFKLSAGEAQATQKMIVGK